MGRNFFHKFRDKVKKEKEIINNFISRSDEDDIKWYFVEKEKLNDLVVLHEEIYWKQRAKAFWLTDVDTNSKLFHAQTSIRKKMNHIRHLITNDWEIVDNHEEICRMTREYFKEVFVGSTVVGLIETNAAIRVITSAQN